MELLSKKLELKLKSFGATLADLGISHIEINLDECQNRDRKSLVGTSVNSLMLVSKVKYLCVLCGFGFQKFGQCYCLTIPCATVVFKGE